MPSPRRFLKPAGAEDEIIPAAYNGCPQLNRSKMASDVFVIGGRTDTATSKAVGLPSK